MNRLLRKGVRAVTGGISGAGRHLRRQVKRGAGALRRLSRPAEGRQQLIDMVDDPAVAHARWAAASFGGKQAVLQAMRTRYGDDWTDEFVTHQENGSSRSEMESYGRAPAIEELEMRGFALASSYAMTLDSSFERWVHPDGRAAQMVRDHAGREPLEAPPSGADLIGGHEEPVEDDRLIDIPMDEIQKLDITGPAPAGTDEALIESRVEDHEDGSRTITVIEATVVYTIECAPDDTCTSRLAVREPE